MTQERREKLMVRWGLVGLAGTVLFWCIWSLFAPVPEMTEIAWSKESGAVITLPFAVSRWWDVSVASNLAVSIVWLITHPKVYPDPGLVFYVGLYAILASGLLVGLLGGLVLGLSIGLCTGLIVSSIVSLAVGLHRGLLAGLIVSLLAGLFHGLAFSLPVALFYGLVMGLAVGLKIVCSSPVWRWTWCWLTVKEPQETVAETKSEPSLPETAYAEAEHAEQEALLKIDAAKAAFEEARAKREEMEAALGGSEQAARVSAMGASRL